MSFDINQIKFLIKDILHDKFDRSQFECEQIRQWNDEILNEIINRLTQIQSKQIHQQMKYIATIIIGEKAGLHTSVSCFWDGTTDGCVTVKWENQNLFLIVTVFGLAI